jgi:hypothetical protein
MSQETTKFIKINWLTLANIILLLGIIIQQAKWQESVNNKIKILEVHVADKEMHMPFSEQIKAFVPRIEIDGRLKSIERLLDKIEKKLDK